MKHRLSIEVRVDGGIEHIFDQVLEGRERTSNRLKEVAQAISDVAGEWQHEQHPGKTWPGMARCFLVTKGSAGTYKKGQEFDIEP